MILLHHCVSARSFRPLWTLEALDLDYELRMLPFPPRVHQRQYLETNPLGTVPAFEDGAVRMTESTAICQYLVDRYGPSPLAVTAEEADYGLYLDMLHFGEATLTFPQTLILRYGRFEAPERRLPQVVEDYTRWFLARLRRIDGLLSDRQYLCAGRLTLADISVGYAVMLADYLKLSAHFPVPVQRYWQRIRADAAFQRALTRQQEAALTQGVPTTPAPLV